MRKWSVTAANVQEPEDEPRDRDHAGECERSQDEARESIGAGGVAVAGALSAGQVGGNPICGYCAAAGALARAQTSLARIIKSALSCIRSGPRARRGSTVRVAASAEGLRS